MKKSLILVGLLSIGYAHAQYDGKVGVNTETPTATLDVKSAIGTDETTKNLELQNANGIKMLTVLDNGHIGVNNSTPRYLLDFNGYDKFVSSTIALRSYREATGSGNFMFYKARGTFEQPKIVKKNDVLGSIGFRSYVGTNKAYNGTYDYYTTSGIQTKVTGDIEDKKHPTSILFKFFDNADDTVGRTRMLLHHTGKVGIGTENPSYRLDIQSLGDSYADNSIALRGFREGNGAIGFDFYRARGTSTVPKTVLKGDYLGGIGISGYSGTRYISTAAIQFPVTGDLTDLQIPTSIAFSLRNINATSFSDSKFYAMLIHHTGNIGVGTNTTEPTNKLHVKGVDPVRLEGLQSSTEVADKVVVVDASGVLKTVDRASIGGGAQGITQEADGIVGNEVTNATADRGLERSGNGDALSPYTLGIKEGGVTEGMLAAGAVTGDKIAEAAITANKLGIPGTDGQVLTYKGNQWVAQAPQGGASLDAITGNIREVPVISKALWTAGVFGLIQTTANGYIDLPDPANYSGRIIAVNNQAGTKIEFGQNSPANYPSIEPGAGFILMSSGSKWYVIGGGI